MTRTKQYRHSQLPPETAAAQALSAPRRPGGSILRNMAILLSITLALAGYFVFSTTDENILFYIGCALLTVSCGYHAISSLFSARLNIGSIISSQTMLWYSLPFSYIYFFGYENYIHQISEIDNAESVAAVILIASLVYVFFELFGKPITLQGVRIDWRNYAPLMIPIILAQTYLIMTGNRGYANVVGVYSERESSLLYQFTVGFSPAVMPMCMVALAGILHSRKRSVIGIAICITGLLVQIMWWTTGGRRYMTIIALVSAVSFFAVYFRGRLNGRRVLAIVAASLVAVPALWFVWESYYLLRIATDVSGGSENLSIFDRRRAQELAAGVEFESQFVENIVRRPFLIVTSLSVVRETASGFLWGWNIVSQALLTVPSAFFPGKLEFIGPILETLWNQELDVPLNDWTNTLFLEGYVDFGLFGFPIYVIIIVLFSKIILNIGRLLANSALISFIYFTLAFWILNVETTVNSIFVCFRSVMTVVFLCALVQIFRRQPRRNYSSVPDR